MICFYLKISENFILLILPNGFGVVHVTFERKVRFRFLAQFQVDIFPTQSSVVFFSLSVSLLHLLNMRLMTLSPSPLNLHLLIHGVLLLFNPWEFFFYISCSWWSLTGVYVTESSLKSPGPFSVFWSFSIMLYFGWSPHAMQPPSPPVPLVIL